jgi:uncharacterized protein YxjI
MSPYEPFTGVLLLPDRAPFGSESPVTLDDGQPVAMIKWQRFSWGAKFDILDPVGGGVLASGKRAGGFGRRYEVTGPGGDVLLELKVSGWDGVSGKSTVTIPGGRVLHAKGNWSARKFEVTDERGRSVAALLNTSKFFSMRRDNLAFELRQAVLSPIQAIGLAQCLREAVESRRSSSAAATST